MRFFMIKVGNSEGNCHAIVTVIVMVTYIAQYDCHASSRSSSNKGENVNYIKLLLVATLLLIPVSTSLTGHHYAFDSFAQQMRFSRLRLKHGEVAVSSDFTHFYRCNNGERCRVVD